MKDNNKNQLLRSKKYRIDPQRKSKKIEPKPTTDDTKSKKH